jgi:hypothetical protein
MITIPAAIIATVEAILLCVAVSLAVSMLVGFAIRAAGPSGMARAAVSYRLAAGAALRRPGERYIGSLADEGEHLGRITHLYIIDAKCTSDWRTARAWAAKHGADLPTVNELLLMRVQARDALDDGIYWTQETPGAHPGWSMTVCASTGEVADEPHGAILDAVAVRRVVV